MNTKNMVIKLFLFSFPVLFGVTLYLLSGDWDVSTNARIVFFILGIAAGLWLTEVVPLHVTSFVIAFLLIFVADFNANEVFASFFDPIIVLFLGGFVIALAFTKYEIDKYLAFYVIKLLGSNYKIILIGLMFFSAFLSMWMSNTAVASLVIPIGITVLASSGLEKNSKLYKLFPLALAYAATIGGLGTIIGSPPNALAVKFLEENGIEISFIEWSTYMIPFVLIFLIISFWLLAFQFKSDKRNLLFDIKEKINLTSRAKFVIFVALFAVFLWIFGGEFGLSSYLTAALAVIILFGTKMLDPEDIRKINWETLLLFGGGIALGEAVKSAEIDLFIASQLETLLGGVSIILLYFILVFVGILFTIVASNTGAAVLMIPIVITIAQQLGLDPVLLVMITTLAVSLDFVLPVGTPASAVAYSTGYIKIHEMVKTGIIATIFMSIIAVFFGYFIW